MQLQALAIRLPQGEEKRLLSAIVQDAARAAAEARQSLWGLRSNPTSPEFSRKLATLVRQVVGNRHISVSLSLEPVSLAGRPDCEFQLLRIAREALTNTLKHASALHLRVSLTNTENTLHLMVEDDGLGFSGVPDDSFHFGLRGMRERAAEIGAEFAIQSAPDRGTRVVVSLPLQAKEQHCGNYSDASVHQLF